MYHRQNDGVCSSLASGGMTLDELVFFCVVVCCFSPRPAGVTGQIVSKKQFLPVAAGARLYRPFQQRSHVIS